MYVRMLHHIRTYVTLCTYVCYIIFVRTVFVRTSLFLLNDNFWISIFLKMISSFFYENHFCSLAVLFLYFFSSFCLSVSIFFLYVVPVFVLFFVFVFVFVFFPVQYFYSFFYSIFLPLSFLFIILLNYLTAVTTSLFGTYGH